LGQQSEVREHRVVGTLLLVGPAPSVDVNCRHEFGALLGSLDPIVEVDGGQVFHDTNQPEDSQWEDMLLSQ
jgi:hypothetical protein